MLTFSLMTAEGHLHPKYLNAMLYNKDSADETEIPPEVQCRPYKLSPKIISLQSK